MSEETLGTTKICTKCGVEKPLEEFGRNASHKDGHASQCLECSREYDRERAKDPERRQANIERSREWYEQNKDTPELKEYRHKYAIDHSEEAKVRAKEWYYNNKERSLASGKEWAKNHPEKVKESRKKWNENNREWYEEYYSRPEVKEHIRKKAYEYSHTEKNIAYRKHYIQENKEQIKAYRANRMKEDPIFNLRIRVSKLVGITLRQRNYSKNTRTYKIIGLQYPELWAYLEQTWLENYGTKWNGERYDIDHIRPLSSANTEQELFALWNWQNLQLLSHGDNMNKLDKLNWEPPKESRAYGRIKIKNGKRILLI